MSLSAQDLARLRDRLEQQRLKLDAQTHDGALESGNKNFTEISGGVRDPGDESMAVQVSDLTISSLEKEIGALHETDAALARMEEGVYGICETCGGEIPLERLKAYPTARRCTDCQARIEARTRRDVTPSL